MGNDKIKEKIHKLLKLSNNPNENEAKQALLKARELMAKYKIKETDINDSSSEVEEFITDITFTKTIGIWIPLLAEAISKNYCCLATSFREIGKKTHGVGIVGFPEDIEIARIVLKYAYDFVKNRCQEIKEEYKDYNVPASYIRNLCNNYGIGFAVGVDRMFKEQNKTTETGIVLVTPKEVSEYTKEMNKKDFDATKHFEKTDEGSKYFRFKGYSDGRKFVPNKSLE